MNQEKLEQLKNKLEQEKQRLEKELAGFTIKNPDVEGDYITKWPNMGDELEETTLDVEPDEIEEYGNRLSVEQSLELQLKDVNDAFEKIEKDAYGICENCGKEIPENRLEVNPAAKTCTDCLK